MNARAPEPTRPRTGCEQPGPVVILVEPQLGENIGAAARAMANFGLGAAAAGQAAGGLAEPAGAQDGASGADRILDDAGCYDTLEEAIADCTFVLATTARAHDQAKPVVDAPEAAAQLAGAADRGGRDRRRRVRPRAHTGSRTTRSRSPTGS